MMKQSKVQKINSSAVEMNYMQWYMTILNLNEKGIKISKN